MQQIIINGLDDLPNAAKKLFNYFDTKKIIAFYGKMGAGKTTFIKALCKIMGVAGVVSSPTFSLINEYHIGSGEKIYHFDFYRINKIEEAYDFGYEEYFYSGEYCFIEWPEKIEPLLPPDVLSIKIEEQADGTRVVMVL